jgi:hypothetical protein
MKRRKKMSWKQSKRRWAWWTLALLVSLTIAGPGANAAMDSGSIQSFKPVTSFNVPGGGVAEIISATSDGKTVVYTNSSGKSLGIVDMTNPLLPSQVATIDLLP